MLRVLRVSASCLMALAVVATSAFSETTYGLSDQAAWEAEWRDLRLAYVTAGTDLDRQYRAADLRDHLGVFEKGDRLEGWIGVLAALTKDKDEVLGPFVFGRVVMRGRTPSTPHEVHFFRPISGDDDPFALSLQSLRDGDLVEISGVVDPSFENVKARMGSLPGRVVRSIVNQVVGDGGPLSALDVEIELSSIGRTPDQRALSHRLEALSSELENLRRYEEQITPLVDLVENWSCEEFRSVAGYPPCPNFLETARSLGVNCPIEAGGHNDIERPSGIWRPSGLKAEIGEREKSILDARAALVDGRFGGDVAEAAIRSTRDFVDASLPVVDEKLRGLRAITACMDQWREERRLASRPPAPETRVSPVEIAPPRGLSWGMAYDEARAHFKNEIQEGELSKKVTQGKKDEGNFVRLPRGWSQAKANWPRFREKDSWVYLGFTSDEALHAFQITYGYISVDPKHQSTMDQWVRVTDYADEISSALSEKYGAPRQSAKARELADPGELTLGAWQDEFGNEVFLVLEREKTGNEQSSQPGTLHTYHIKLRYFSKQFVESSESSIKDDF